MTKDWLVELAPVLRAERETPVLVSDLPRTENLDLLLEKLATAEILGRQLAHEHPDVILIKEAGIPTGVLNMGKTVANKMIKAPGGAMRSGGAIAGGVLGGLRQPGIDPQTGMQRSRLGGAAVGALAGYGAGAMAGKSQAAKTFVQRQGQELKGSVQQARAAAKAARQGGASAVGTPGVSAPGAGAQNPITPAPGSGVAAATPGGRSLFKPGTWFGKQAEALQTNDGLVEHSPLTGPGKQSAPTDNTERGKTKKALALPAGMMAGAKNLGRMALRRPGTAAALGGAALGAAAGGPDHRLSGAALGAGAGLGLQRSGMLNGAAQKLRGAVGAGEAAAAPAAAPAMKTLGGMGGAPAPAHPTLMGGPATSQGSPQLAHLSKATNPELHAARPHYPGDSAADVMAEWGANSPEHQQAVERYMRSSQEVSPLARTQLAAPGTTPGLAPQRGGTQPRGSAAPRTTATKLVRPETMEQMIQQPAA